ncbi:hypothetical protein BCF55_0219 [Hydrogenivirga caldilitoris]|uniref:Uncharacterized protein n=1 Tax=Hydrogenivirga caldilitoris TaxID=246264 RepID=A0A497XPB5_9AQUI|nr:hypothetical protein [Hydrogenivirga caldilitoris]RLJ69959.1 hypothetical protein BCF55_0219 [Hydrogenivirga caldilitoris]
MDRKRSVFKAAEYVKILKKFQPSCWEEADYAQECIPSNFKNLNGTSGRREDYYVDFSDIVAVR